MIIDEILIAEWKKAILKLSTMQSQAHLPRSYYSLAIITHNHPQFFLGRDDNYTSKQIYNRLSNLDAAICICLSEIRGQINDSTPAFSTSVHSNSLSNYF